MRSGNVGRNPVVESPGMARKEMSNSMSNRDCQWVRLRLPLYEHAVDESVAPRGSHDGGELGCACEKSHRAPRGRLRHVPGVSTVIRSGPGRTGRGGGSNARRHSSPVVVAWPREPDREPSPGHERCLRWRPARRHTPGIITTICGHFGVPGRVIPPGNYR